MDFILIVSILFVVILVYIFTIYTRIKLLKEILNMPYSKAKSLSGEPLRTFNCMLTMINIYKYALPVRLDLYQDDIMITVLGNSLIVDCKNVKYVENYCSNNLLIETEDNNSIVLKFLFCSIPKELKDRLKTL